MAKEASGERPATMASEGQSTVLGLVGACALLAAIVLPCAVVVALVVSRSLTSDALLSAALGGGVCLAAGVLALAITFVGNRFRSPVPAVLGATIVRMGLPLAAVVVLPRLSNNGIPAGMISTILGVYMIALVAETLLSLRMVPSATGPARAG